jgi:HD-GYP domain-containing protein (c-di-GMP phosphodiesterase class II)
MIQRRIREGELAAGQPLPWNVYDQNGVLLLAQGMLVRGPLQLARLVAGGYYLVEPSAAWHQQPYSALQYILHAYYRLALLYEQPERGGDFAAQALAIAQLIEAGYRRHPGVAIATVALRQNGRYAVRHSIHTACVVAAVLHAMPEEDRPDSTTVLAAALTMNIGMLDLQDILAYQQQPLTPSQQARVERHPFDSVARLRQLGVQDELWLSTVLQHHEALDGSGYPQRLSGAQILPPAQLVGLADLFCARVSGRSYRPADSAKAVLRDVLLERGQRFDALLAAYFIRALGVYPIGTVVGLANGELGVVSVHAEKVDAPLVHRIKTADGTALPVPQPCRTDLPEYAIVRVANGAEQQDARIDMEAIWGEEARDFPRGQELKPPLAAWLDDDEVRQEL